jgi:beta-mannosidase
VHTDFLAAGAIEEPYHRDNELGLLWIGETDWVYVRTFTVEAALLQHERVLLHCAGLDTIATIQVNGTKVGYADNMFRTWEFDVKPLLKAGENTISVHFDAPVAYHRKKSEQFRLPAWGVGLNAMRVEDGGWIRKEPCNFGWDWGPMLTTAGIWKDIALLAFDTARLCDVQVLQEHTAGQVTLTVNVTAEQVGAAALTAEVKLSLEGACVASAQVKLQHGQGTATLVIQNPQLWWPNNMGAQTLYDLNVTLQAGGACLDQDHKRIGLRTLRLVREPDQWGESFHFAVNGVAFFAKGANWIPAETFATRLTQADYERLIQDTVAANMNMLRVWGGGLYEDDRFYDACDRYGVCLWQDFIFACGTYPTFDAEFMANVKVEAEQNVRRLRHHACLAMWCGNNELEQGLVGEEWTERTMSWEDYDKLYMGLLPNVVAALDPQRDYWPSSPHTPDNRYDFNNPDSGDAHLWSVWHGKQPFEWYRGCTHRFNSEFGFQSFPEPKTTYAYTEPQDRNITSFVMEHHQRSGIGNTTIMTYMLDWFRLPDAFDNVLWLSQILQGMAIKYACEHWRRAMPRGMGTLYWQLNDCWPAPSWSSIDSVGRWKALHYMAKSFFAPLLVSGLEDLAAGTVELHVTSDRLQDTQGTVSWLLTDVAGTTLATGASETPIGARQNTLVQTLDVNRYLQERGKRDLLLWLELTVDDKVVSTNFVPFSRPKHYELQKPNIVAKVRREPGQPTTIHLETDKPALWVWLELKDVSATFSNNFLHLIPGKPVEITVRPWADLTTYTIEEQLVIKSLVDTY